METNMRRITISIPPADLEKVEQYASQKALILSEYLRLLIRIGLTVEEAAMQKNHDEQTQSLSLDEQTLLWETQLTWQLETCLLVRHLADTLTQASLERRNELFEEAKEKAQTHVQTLLQQLKKPAD